LLSGRASGLYLLMASPSSFGGCPFWAGPLIVLVAEPRSVKGRTKEEGIADMILHATTCYAPDGSKGDLVAVGDENEREISAPYFNKSIDYRVRMSVHQQGFVFTTDSLMALHVRY
jgi:hypothetical protein